MGGNSKKNHSESKPAEKSKEPQQKQQQQQQQQQQQKEKQKPKQQQQKQKQEDKKVEEGKKEEKKVTLEELFETPDFLKGNKEIDVNFDKPTDGVQPTLSEKLEGFNKLVTALKQPDNASVARPFIIASVAMFALPLLVFQLVLHVLLPLLGLGDVPLDQEVFLGADRVTLSGVCAVLCSWLVMISYTVYAWFDNPPRKQEFAPNIPPLPPRESEGEKKKAAAAAAAGGKEKPE